jgi:hypothetical protein
LECIWDALLVIFGKINDNENLSNTRMNEEDGRLLSKESYSSAWLSCESKALTLLGRPETKG